MQVHGSCVARNGSGVLLLGPPGSGKSDLALRLIDRGFILVADDRVDIIQGCASPPAALAGLLEVRGLGILRFDHAAGVKLALAVRLDRAPERLPCPETDALGLTLIALDAFHASAAQRVALALDVATGRTDMLAGAFVPEQAR